MSSFLELQPPLLYNTRSRPAHLPLSHVLANYRLSDTNTSVRVTPSKATEAPLRTAAAAAAAAAAFFHLPNSTVA